MGLGPTKPQRVIRFAKCKSQELAFTTRLPQFLGALTLLTLLTPHRLSTLQVMLARPEPKAIPLLARPATQPRPGAPQQMQGTRATSLNKLPTLQVRPPLPKLPLTRKLLILQLARRPNPSQLVEPARTTTGP